MHRTNRRERLLTGAGLAVLAVLAGVAFKARLDPAMLIDFASMLVCA